MTHADMIRVAVKELKEATPTGIMNYIAEKYKIDVKPTSFRADIIGCSINHSSSKHYPSLPKFLFYNKENRTYRLFDTEKDNLEVENDEEDSIEDTEEIIEASLSFEKDLEEYLFRKVDCVEEGLVIYDEEGIKGRQVSLKTGKADILAKDKEGNLVVIELKVGKADIKVLGQILSYIAAIRTEITNDKKVRGIIIAEDFEDRLKIAISETPHIELKRYNVNFSFEKV